MADLGTDVLKVKSGIALVNGLELRKRVCLHIRSGEIESIESFSTCGTDYLGNESLVAVPEPANAHIHSADYAFPEYAYDKTLEEAVAPPDGVKHRMFSSLDDRELKDAIKNVYLYSWRIGVGLLADFREGGGIGCLMAKEVLERIPDGLTVRLLGRPGPFWPKGCDGLGLSSIFSLDDVHIAHLISKYRPAHVHLSETKSLRKKGDFEKVLRYNFDAVVHGNYLTAEDLYMLKDKNIYLVLCVRSNMWHGLKLPLLKEIFRYKIPIALGTDNAGLVKPNIWRELEEALLLLRINDMKEEEVPKTLLKAVFINGYRAVGLKPRIISEGEKTHLLLFDGETSGILKALNTYYAMAKRLDYDFLLYRLDKEKMIKII